MKKKQKKIYKKHNNKKTHTKNHKNPIEIGWHRFAVAQYAARTRVSFYWVDEGKQRFIGRLADDDDDVAWASVIMIKFTPRIIICHRFAGRS